MATDKPRITITLEPEHYALLRRLSALNGESMSSIVGELVESVAPTLSRVADVLEHAATVQGDAMGELRRIAEEAERQFTPLMTEGEAFFDRVMTETEAALDPRAVTRGSRPPHPPTPTPPSGGGS